MKHSEEQQELAKKLIDSYAHYFQANSPEGSHYNAEVNRPHAIKQAVFLLNMQIDIIEGGAPMSMLGEKEVKSPKFYKEVISYLEKQK